MCGAQATCLVCSDPRNQHLINQKFGNHRKDRGENPMANQYVLEPPPEWDSQNCRPKATAFFHANTWRGHEQRRGETKRHLCRCLRQA